MIHSRRMKDIAGAVAALAHAEGLLPTVIHDLRAVAQAFTSAPHALLAFGEIALPLSDRASRLKRALAENVHPLALETVLLLQEYKLLSELNDFVSVLISQAEANQMYVEVVATSSLPFHASDQRELEQIIKKRFGDIAELVTRIDPRVTGGVRLDIGGQKIDATIHERCRQLAQALAQP